jgi:hypothetical protein
LKILQALPFLALINRKRGVTAQQIPAPAHHEINSPKREIVFVQAD